MLAHIERNLHGDDRSKDLYSEGNPFEDFIHYGTNPPLYENTSEFLRIQFHTIAREMGADARGLKVLDLGVGSGMALVPVMKASHPPVSSLTLVEPSRDLLAITQKSLSELGIPHQACQCTAQAFLEQHANSEEQYDLIEATFSLQNLVSAADRERLFRWALSHLHPKWGRMVIAEFDVPTYVSGLGEHFDSTTPTRAGLLNPARIEYFSRTYQQGVAEYVDHPLVIRGFLMPILFGKFTTGGPCTTLELPASRWESELRAAGFRQMKSGLFLLSSTSFHSPRLGQQPSKSDHVGHAASQIFTSESTHSKMTVNPRAEATFASIADLSSEPNHRPTAPTGESISFVSPYSDNLKDALSGGKDKDNPFNVIEGPENEDKLEDNDDSTPDPISLPLVWNLPARQVFVSGSFNNWSEKIPLKTRCRCSGHPELAQGSWGFPATIQAGVDFCACNPPSNHWSVSISLAPSVYSFRFIVDGAWQHNPSLPTKTDSYGNAYNWTEVKVPSIAPAPALRHSASSTSTDSDHPSPYSQQMPDWLIKLAEAQRAFEAAMRDPSLPAPSVASLPRIPYLSPLLASSVLDAPIPPRTENFLLPIPQHVSIHHFYSNVRPPVWQQPGVVVLSTTQRFQKKLFTVVLYTSDKVYAQRTRQVPYQPEALSITNPVARLIMARRAGGEILDSPQSRPPTPTSPSPPTPQTPAPGAPGAPILPSSRPTSNLRRSEREQDEETNPDEPSPFSSFPARATLARGAGGTFNLPQSPPAAYPHPAVVQQQRPSPSPSHRSPGASPAPASPVVSDPSSSPSPHKVLSLVPS
ncbi:putative methyltransferase type 12 [Paratrimastix pyriformis]|uniref:Methyltransferase type 12 n=1 Tax=Paratrimastix pyriformis TaxID=342808 RepID=A0ABQ8UIU3_9EUKA|nr:putative methyltransferase type 12 [Paratrimastix pyriformis]